MNRESIVFCITLFLAAPLSRGQSFFPRPVDIDFKNFLAVEGTVSNQRSVTFYGSFDLPGVGNKPFYSCIPWDGIHRVQPIASVDMYAEVIEGDADMNNLRLRTVIQDERVFLQNFSTFPICSASLNNREMFGKLDSDFLERCANALTAKNRVPFFYRTQTVENYWLGVPWESNKFSTVYASIERRDDCQANEEFYGIDNEAQQCANRQTELMKSPVPKTNDPRCISTPLSAPQNIEPAVNVTQDSGPQRSGGRQWYISCNH